MPEGKSIEKDFAGFFDDPRTEDSSRELEAWLHADNRNIERFVDLLLVHNDLNRHVLADDMSAYEHGGRTQQAETAFSADDLDIVCSVRPERGPIRRGTWRYVSAVLAVAAGLLLANLAYDSSRTDRNQVADQRPPAAQTPDAPTLEVAEEQEDKVNESVVATFSDAEDVVWRPQQAPMSFGEHLRHGAVLALVSGVAQLTFETGAVAVAEGPCLLEVQENAVQVTHGRVSATVPRQASGFTVTTPTSQVVDLGTELGVDVDPTGDTRVHVFRGEVVSCRLDDLGQPVGDFVHLTASRAIEFRRGTEEAKRFAANEAAFVRHLRSHTAETALHAPPVAGDLRVWLAADHQLLRDAEGGVIAWRDSMSEHLGDLPDNALQPVEEYRPVFVESAIADKPALRFDGVDDCLVTTPFTNGDSQTVVFVAALDAASGYGGQLINYNGPPQLEHDMRPRPGILQIRACLDGIGGEPLLDPYVYVCRLNDDMIFVGRMEEAARRAPATLGAPRLDQPVVGVYAYNHEKNHAALYLNGALVGESTAPLPATVTSRKVIGRHGSWRRYFAGLIAELMIFDEGLDPGRVADITRHLGGKYEIEVD
ncbi:MAG: LamG-like jellyroll fold domain-containing protein [Planctomycetota bacterium]